MARPLPHSRSSFARLAPLRKKGLPFLVALILGVLFCAVSAEVLGSSLWFFGLPSTVVLCLYFELAVARGRKRLAELTPERLSLNLKASGLERLPTVWPFQLRFFILSIVLLSCFFYVMRDRVAETLIAAVEALRPEEIVLRIEYPTFAETAALETFLGSEEHEFKADTGSYLQLFVKNKKQNSQWQLQIEAKNLDGTESLGIQNDALGSAGSYSQIVSSLYSQFKLPEKVGSQFLLTLSNGSSKMRKAKLIVSPVPVPVVTLEMISGNDSQEPSGAESGSGKLVFNARAQSKVPLALVELAVRTESGYRFNKTLGEFANSNELDFETKQAELSTFGIPFSASDVLYVKAVAKTVVSGLEGSSREIKIEIKSRQQIREQVAEKLKNALEELRSTNKPFEQSQSEILENLQAAESAAKELGRQSMATRQARAAIQNAQKMQAKGDKEAKAAEKKIEAALESLKRESASEEMGNLFARLQSLKSSVSRAQDDELSKLAKDAEKLKADANELHGKLEQALQSPSANLSPEEQQTAKRMLEKDKTGEKLADAAKALEKSSRNNASQSANEAFDESQKSLGSVMQLLQAARARAMKEARERLTQADGQLEKARGKAPQKAQSEVNQAQKDLAQTPQLSQEFNDALNEARQAGKEAQKKAQKGDQGEFQDAVQQAQDGIVKALAALQDEEESQRQQNRDQDGQNYRTAMDALSAQGQLDVGWRKRILDEIARLRGRGESADSPLIKYLESRLR